MKKIDWSKFHEFWKSNSNIFNSIDFINSQVRNIYSFVSDQINKAIEISMEKKNNKKVIKEHQL